MTHLRGEIFKVAPPTHSIGRATNWYWSSTYDVPTATIVTLSTNQAGTADRDSILTYAQISCPDDSYFMFGGILIGTQDAAIAYVSSGWFANKIEFYFPGGVAYGQNDYVWFIIGNYNTVAAVNFRFWMSGYYAPK